MSRIKYPIFMGLALFLMMTLAGFQSNALAGGDDCCPKPVVLCPAPAPVVSCPAPVVSCPVRVVSCPAPVISCPAPAPVISCPAPCPAPVVFKRIC